MTPVLQVLIDRYDSAVAAVLADPRVARDSGNVLVETYVGLFTPDSSFPATVIAGWQREADQGRFYRAGPNGVMRQSSVMEVTAQSSDEVAFTICVRNSVVVTDEAGNTIESQGGVTAGTIRAGRVDGIWLIRDLSQSSPEGCPPPRTAP